VRSSVKKTVIPLIWGIDRGPPRDYTRAIMYAVVDWWAQRTATEQSHLQKGGAAHASTVQRQLSEFESDDVLRFTRSVFSLQSV